MMGCLILPLPIRELLMELLWDLEGCNVVPFFAGRRSGTALMHCRVRPQTPHNRFAGGCRSTRLVCRR